MPFGRKSLLGMLAIYAGLALAVSVASRALSCVQGEAARSGAVPTELLTFLGPVAAGMRLETWTIEHVGPIHEGGLRVALRPASGVDPPRAPAQNLVLELTRLSPGGPRPLASTDTLAIYSVRPGPPRTPTSDPGLTPPEELAAAAALARVVRAREALAAPPLPLLSR